MMVVFWLLSPEPQYMGLSRWFVESKSVVTFAASPIPPVSDDGSSEDPVGGWKTQGGPAATPGPPVRRPRFTDEHGTTAFVCVGKLGERGWSGVSDAQRGRTALCAQAHDDLKGGKTMRCDRNPNAMNSGLLLLTGDRRLEPRRACHATIWLLDEDLERVIEFGAAVEISRAGVTFDSPSNVRLTPQALSPGREWLVLLDDPSGLEPLADQRPVLLQLLRACERPDGSWRLACRFASRSVGRCAARSAVSLRRCRADLSDVISGDLLDEIAERIAGDLLASERAETWRPA